MPEITILIAFLAGIVSFISPCVLPLVPAYISYLAGIRSMNINSKEKRFQIIINTLIFIFGFSLVFSILGLLLTILLGKLTLIISTWLRRIGGIIIIVFGLYLVKLLDMPFLEKNYYLFKIKNLNSSYLTSFIFGVSFATGWTPCVGAILGSIISLALISKTSAFILLFFYSLGLSFPFLLSAIFFTKLQGLLGKNLKFLNYVRIIFGIVLIILGILVFTNKLIYIVRPAI